MSVAGIEPTMFALKGTVLQTASTQPIVESRSNLKRVARIELAYLAWKASAQPLYHTLNMLSNAPNQDYLIRQLHNLILSQNQDFQELV